MDARGLHSFVCRTAPGRSARHHAFNDFVARCFASAGTPATKEPTGLFRTDEKRPDGLTLVPWQSGKSLCWDVTVICPLANHTSLGPPARQVLQRNSPLLAKRKNMPALEANRIPLCANRCRNLGPDEHVGMSTVCQPVKKDFLSVRRRQGRSFSIPESFGAGAALQRCIVT